MYIVLFTVLFVVVYVVSFKDNFNKENIDKVAPIFIGAIVITILLSLITSAMQG